MILDAATLRDILGIIGFGTFICLLPLLVVIGLIYSTVVKIRQGTAHQKLGQALGFSPVTRSTDIKNTPYSGLYKGRAVAIRTFSSAYTYYMDGRSRRGFNIKLRIVAEVRLAHLLRTKVYNRESWKTAQNFDEAFVVDGGSLSVAVREAFLSFAYLGHKTGLRKDLRMIFVRGMRNLSLSDRKDVPKGWISDETLPNVNVILTHDHPYVDISIDEFRGILDDIDAVAEAIETDRVPRLLAGGTTPPPIDKGIYANWAFIGLIVIGLPACICVWGVLLTFLDSY